MRIDFPPRFAWLPKNRMYYLDIYGDIMKNIVINGKEIEKTGAVMACGEKAVVKGGSCYDQGRKGRYLFKKGETFEIKPYEIGKYQVTQELYRAVLGGKEKCWENPSKFRAFPDDGEVQERRPVESVTWFDAVYFCNELTKRTMGEEHCVYTITDIRRSEKSGFFEPGAYEFVCFMKDGSPVEQYTGKGSEELQYEESDKGYIFSANVAADYEKKGWRLPTEEEWEYAARGGEKATPVQFKNAWSGAALSKRRKAIPAEDEALGDVAWHEANAGGKTHEVGLKNPNALGAHDMSGNVFEWCSDLYAYDGFDDGKIRCGNERQARGGSFIHNAALCSVARRRDFAPSKRTFDVGFRLARTI